MELNELNVLLRIKEIMEQGLEHIFIISNSFCFFNKADFE